MGSSQSFMEGGSRRAPTFQLDRRSAPRLSFRREPVATAKGRPLVGVPARTRPELGDWRKGSASPPIATSDSESLGRHAGTLHIQDPARLHHPAAYPGRSSGSLCRWDDPKSLLVLSLGERWAARWLTEKRRCDG